jgi:hypothetical protein
MTSMLFSSDAPGFFSLASAFVSEAKPHQTLIRINPQAVPLLKDLPPQERRTKKPLVPSLCPIVGPFIRPTVLGLIVVRSPSLFGSALRRLRLKERVEEMANQSWWFVHPLVEL